MSARLCTCIAASLLPAAALPESSVRSARVFRFLPLAAMAGCAAGCSI